MSCSAPSSATGVRAGIAASADPLDWANRRIDLPTGGWAVAGIRFRGLDVTRPFVDVVATTEPPTPDGLAVVADAVLPSYASFDPLCLRVDAPDPAGLVEHVAADERFGPRCSVDQYVVAGLVAELRGRPRAPSYDSSRCGPATRPPSPSGPPPSTPSSRGATPTC